MYCQLSPHVANQYNTLVAALDSRFRQRKAARSYLCDLKERRLQPNEDIAKFIGDLRTLTIKSYPTADHATTEGIALEHFLVGLQDDAAALAIGMKEPADMEAARDLLQTYYSYPGDASLSLPEPEQYTRRLPNRKNFPPRRNMAGWKQLSGNCWAPSKRTARQPRSGERSGKTTASPGVTPRTWSAMRATTWGTTQETAPPKLPTTRLGPSRR